MVPNVVVGPSHSCYNLHLARAQSLYPDRTRERAARIGSVQLLSDRTQRHYRHPCPLIAAVLAFETSIARKGGEGEDARTHRVLAGSGMAGGSRRRTSCDGRGIAQPLLEWRRVA